MLVARDDADVTPSVLDWTRTLADSFGANVTAFHVMSSAVLSHVLSMQAVTTGQETFTETDIKQEFRDETDRWIRALVESGLDPAHVTSEVAFGEAGQEILWAAERLSCDLIVLGRRGGGAIRRFFLGSVAREVVTGARCPVFVVVEPTDEIVSESAENGAEHPQE
jgi:nucleotide-binding universal stress UspA family protein